MNRYISRFEFLLKLILIYIIKFYQLFISPYLGRSCRFYPSCSNYFIDVLRRQKIIRALILGIYRIIRCNPLNKGGYDPPP